jgi:FkbM family methyltransferase
VVTTRGDALQFFFNAPEQTIPTLVMFREFVEPEYEFARRLLRPGETFVDVGAAIGTYSVLIASRTGAIVHAVEPMTPNLVMLRRNLRANRVEASVHVHEVAVSDEEGLAWIRAGRNLYLSKLESAEAPGSHQIRRTTLAELARSTGLGTIDLLKVDVEGHEPEVLAGAWTLLEARRVPVLSLERNERSDSTYRMLQGLGYRFFDYDTDANALVATLHPLDTPRSVFASNVVAVLDDHVPSTLARLNGATSLA